jgi:hypothetical protein
MITRERFAAFRERKSAWYLGGGIGGGVSSGVSHCDREKSLKILDCRGPILGVRGRECWSHFHRAPRPMLRYTARLVAGSSGGIPHHRAPRTKVDLRAVPDPRRMVSARNRDGRATDDQPSLPSSKLDQRAPYRVLRRAGHSIDRQRRYQCQPHAAGIDGRLHGVENGTAHGNGPAREGTRRRSHPAQLGAPRLDVGTDGWAVPNTPWAPPKAPGVHHVCYWSDNSAEVCAHLTASGNKRVLGRHGASSGYFLSPSRM